MVRILDIQSASDALDVVHEAVESIVRGDLVVLPAETSYVVGFSAAIDDNDSCRVSPKSGAPRFWSETRTRHSIMSHG